MTDIKRANDYQIGGNHYAQGGNHQHWNFVEDFNIGYLECLATKYLVRWDKKGIPVQDLRKCLHTIDRLLEAVTSEGRVNKASPVPTVQQVMVFCSDNKIANPAVCRAIELLYCWQLPIAVQQARELISRLLEEQPSQRVRSEYDSGGLKSRMDGQEHPFGYDATQEGVSDEEQGKSDPGALEKIWEAPGASGSEDQKDSEPASGQDTGGSDR